MLLLGVAGVFLFLSDREPDTGSVVDVTASPVPATPAHGGTYVEGTLEMPGTFIPFLAQSRTELDLARILFEGLTRVDGTGMPQPALASDWTVSEDGRSYTFTLRPEATWHDGQPVTGQDVLFTVRLVQSPDFPGDPALARFWRGVTVTEVEESSVTFELLEPFAAFPNYADLPLLPRHVLGSVLPGDLPADGFAADPVGTGPFQLAAVDADARTVTLRAFDGYYGGRPYLDQVVFRSYSDTDGLLEALREGDIQGTGAVPIDQAVRPGALPHDAVIYGPSLSSYTALFFNLRDPLFASADLRRAIALGIDREQILEGPLGGHAEAGSSPIPPSSWAHAPLPAEHNRDEARRLLDEAGWSEIGNDGIRVKGTSRLSFSLLVNNDDPQRLAVASEIARQMQEIGVQVIVQPAASAAVSQALGAQQFAAALFGWHAASGDPDPSQLWHSSGADEGLNFTGLRDDEIDSLLTNARTVADRDERRDLYWRFQEAFAEQNPAVVLYHPRYYFVASRGVHGVEPAPVIDPADRLDGLRRWFVETAGAASPEP